MLLNNRFIRFVLALLATAGISVFEGVAQPSTARISGTVVDRSTRTLVVRVGDFGRGYSTTEISCADGVFEIDLPVAVQTEVELSSDGKVLARVLVAPNQLLHIERIDGDLNFTGSAALVNIAMRKYLENNPLSGFSPSYTVASAEQFVEILDRNIEIERKRLERELSDAPQALRRWAEADINYRNAGYAVEYARRNNLKDSVSRAHLYNPERFPIDSAGGVCLNYYAYAAAVANDCYVVGDKLVSRLRAQGNFIDAYVVAVERVAVREPDPSRRDLISAMILSQAYGARNRTFEEVLERIHDRQVIGDQLIEQLDRQRRDRADMRRFTAHTFDRLLAESHHKVIYIDVWATWCPPCHREMKHLRRMEERLKGDNIKFVSFCVSSPYPQWAQTVDLPENRSANYWLDDEAQAVLDRYIRIRSFPRFFVLSGGEIVNENVQWPSSNDLIDGILRGYVEELKSPRNE